MDRVWYTTREAVKSALDIKETARSNNAVDRAIRTGSDLVEGVLRRVFYPEIDTRYFDWPSNPFWRLWLNENELISVDTFLAGTVSIGSSDYFLEPKGNGPPFTSIDLDRSTSVSLIEGDTNQNALAITGLYGYRNDEESNGLLAEALDTTETGVDVTDSSAIGVGSLIRVDSERMQVTGKSYMDTTVNLVGNMDADNADGIVDVADGTLFFVGETVLIGAEKMLIVEIAGNNLIVERAYDGTTLAAHTAGDDVYAPRRLTVVRGVLGTTAASHLTATAISRWLPPPLVEELCIAEALNVLSQRASGWAREVGSDENRREATGRGLKEIRRLAIQAHGRKLMTRAV